MSLRKLAYAATVGAVYAALTILIAPIAYGPIQFRISEVLCILPFFFPYTAWGLFSGCLLANLLSAYGILDIVFGPIATLIAALLTMWLGMSRRRGKFSTKALACLFPVIVNGIIIGAVIAVSSTPEAFWPAFLTFGLQVAFGEFVVMYALGLPLMLYLPRMRFFNSPTADHNQ